MATVFEVVSEHARNVVLYRDLSRAWKNIGKEALAQGDGKAAARAFRRAAHFRDLARDYERLIRLFAEACYDVPY